MLESPYVLELQAEAKREAKREAKLEAVKMVLEERFGPVPADLLHRLDATTDLAKVDQLLRAAAHISRVEELPL